MPDRQRKQSSTYSAMHASIHTSIIRGLSFRLKVFLQMKWMSCLQRWGAYPRQVFIFCTGAGDGDPTGYLGGSRRPKLLWGARVGTTCLGYLAGPLCVASRLLVLVRQGTLGGWVEALTGESPHAQSPYRRLRLIIISLKEFNYQHHHHPRFCKAGRPLLCTPIMESALFELEPVGAESHF